MKSNRKRDRKSSILVLFVCLSIALCGCDVKEYRDKFVEDSETDKDKEGESSGANSLELKYIDERAEDMDKETIYLTGNPQEIADSVFDMICATNNVKDFKKLVSEQSSVNTSRIKEIIETLDGNIENEKCIYIDVEALTNEESSNECAFYSIHCYYYLTVDGNEYILEFYTILVDEYELYKHGIWTLRIEDYADFNVDNHRSDYVTSDAVAGHEVLEYVQTVYAKHHENVMSMGEHCRVPESIELMEEILYCMEEQDNDTILDLYSNINVNSKDDIEKYKIGQVNDLMDTFGGKKLSAVGSILCSYDYSLKPSIVDCDDIEKPYEYILRYIVSDGENEYKLQVVYIPEYSSEEYEGIQSISFVK